MIHVVTGPPAAGKTQYVRQHAKPGDLVLDWDVMLAAMCTLPLYTRPEPLPYYANVAMKAVVSALRNAAMHGRERPETWLIRSLPDAAERRSYAAYMPIGLGAHVIVLACPVAVCHARIDADPARAGSLAEQHAAVDGWWARYAPAECDDEQRTW